MKNLVNNPFLGSWEDLIKLISDNTIDCVITDPPYGLEYVSNRRVASKKHKMLKNDDNLDWLDNFVDEMYRVLKDNSNFYCFSGWQTIDKFKIAIQKRFKINSFLVFDKMNHGTGDLYGSYGNRCEYIFHCSKGRKILNGGRLQNILSVPKCNSKNHPTEKPIQLLKILIEKSTIKGDLVFDPFSGVNSLGRACVETNRNFITSEIDDIYFETGKTLLNNVRLSLD